jgi:hypothetical protein
MRRIGRRREEYFAVAEAALLKAKHRKSIGNPGKSGYLLRQRGNERFVGKQEVIRFFPVSPQSRLVIVRNDIVLFSV